MTTWEREVKSQRKKKPQIPLPSINVKPKVPILNGNKFCCVSFSKAIEDGMFLCSRINNKLETMSLFKHQWHRNCLFDYSLYVLGVPSSLCSGLLFCCIRTSKSWVGKARGRKVIIFLLFCTMHKMFRLSSRKLLWIPRLFSINIWPKVIYKKHKYIVIRKVI